MTIHYLVADIGGTNARFAIATGSSQAGFELAHIRRFRNQDFEHLRDAAQAYLQSWDGPNPSRGCLAIAAPIKPGQIRLTNSAWRFEPEQLAQELGLEWLMPANDFAAQASGAPLCPESDQLILNEGRAIQDAPIAVLGPGTGLGLGLLVGASPRQVISTEGGHAGFAPRTEEEIAVGRFIAKEFGFASWERLLSGRGLVNIHRALCAIDNETWPGLRPEEITAEAVSDPDSRSYRTVMLFCAVLGAFVGDVSVMTGARGGIYLAGGILPRIKDLLLESAFEAHRTRRGPMSAYVEDIPVRLILSDKAPLLGAALLAETGAF